MIFMLNATTDAFRNLHAFSTEWNKMMKSINSKTSANFAIFAFAYDTASYWIATSQICNFQRFDGVFCFVHGKVHQSEIER